MTVESTSKQALEGTGTGNCVLEVGSEKGIGVAVVGSRVGRGHGARVGSSVLEVGRGAGMEVGTKLGKGVLEEGSDIGIPLGTGAGTLEGGALEVSWASLKARVSVAV
eukprot:CAMPEP_0172624662 /NCGR_PEP_ID=MMETSP1068-20121228/138458_1 /TAXON_ID=35684 /ORGANISM="Pseudopedinella elastica, Strain CCMP716" /LENGTH=107 /DNA_ID=CAMNT_0013433711 /DNA_START=208 /DNA_END=532 /DNA_ORIENTATION=+